MSEETQSPEPKLGEPKKTMNLRADALPTSGFVLSVDGKLKTRYETANEAATAGAKLKQRYPVIKVEVYDARAGVYTPVDQPQEA